MITVPLRARPAPVRPPRPQLPLTDTDGHAAALVAGRHGTLAVVLGAPAPAQRLMGVLTAAPDDDLPTGVDFVLQSIDADARPLGIGHLRLERRAAGGATVLVTVSAAVTRALVPGDPTVIARVTADAAAAHTLLTALRHVAAAH